MKQFLFLPLFIALLQAGRFCVRAENDPDVIPNQYIVFYKEDTDPDATNERLFFSADSSIASSKDFRVVHELRTAIAVAGISDEQYEALRQDPSVENVIPDYIMSIDAVSSWGLDRIDQTSLPLNGAYVSQYTGAGVQVYVMDTGIKKSHVDFGGRATCGINFIAGEQCDDYDSHGTHVAGTVGGTTYGVAKGVTLIDVKVLDANGNGSLSGFLAGIEYVTIRKQQNPSTPMVVNMSLGFSVAIPEVKPYIDDAVAQGIVVVVAAGNSASDACGATPAFIPSAITVGASDINDLRARFSNFGNCVDLYAPGVKIVSADFSSQSSKILSGTSMASPHVAGVAALYLEAHPTWTPAQVWNAMREDTVDAMQRTAFPLENYFRNRRTTERLLQVQFI